MKQEKLLAMLLRKNITVKSLTDNGLRVVLSGYSSNRLIIYQLGIGFHQNILWLSFQKIITDIKT